MAQWFQRLAWAIGRVFCEVPSDRMAADIEVLKMHVAECNRRNTEIERRLEAVNRDRRELMARLFKPAEPPALRLMGDG